MLNGRKILIAVTGGIAAYKTCELVRLLIKNRADVQVIMTESAARFVAPLTFEAISGKQVLMELFVLKDGSGGHLRVLQDVDLMVIAPATGNIIGKCANGIADDLVSTVLLANDQPLLICPAMNPKMYAHPALQDNIGKLKSRGVQVMDPDEGPMASSSEEPGIGRMPEPAAILRVICSTLPPVGQLNGKSIIVSAGPTREILDPVRSISNLSSGKMGFAIAEEARRRGASVNLVSGPVRLDDPLGIPVDRVESTQEMFDAVSAHFDKSDILIMAAAPSDFKHRHPSKQKIKKESGGESHVIDLVKTTDILKELSSRRKNKIVVGFALETEAGIENACRKLKAKKLDMIVLNHPDDGDDAGIGKNGVRGTLIDATVTPEELPLMSKQEFAGILLDRVTSLLSD